MSETDRPERPADGRWVMQLVKTGPAPTEFHVYIGELEIATICFNRAGSKNKCYVRYFGLDIIEYQTMSDALRDIHLRLKKPAPEGQS